jgi:hypothetical protein
VEAEEDHIILREEQEALDLSLEVTQVVMVVTEESGEVSR